MCVAAHETPPPNTEHLAPFLPTIRLMVAVFLTQPPGARWYHHHPAYVVCLWSPLSCVYYKKNINAQFVFVNTSKTLCSATQFSLRGMISYRSATVALPVRRVPTRPQYNIQLLAPMCASPTHPKHGTFLLSERSSDSQRECTLRRVWGEPHPIPHRQHTSSSRALVPPLLIISTSHLSKPL